LNFASKEFDRIIYLFEDTTYFMIKNRENRVVAQVSRDSFIGRLHSLSSTIRPIIYMNLVSSNFRR